MLIIAEIIKVNQPEVYELLCIKYDIYDTDIVNKYFTVAEEDELPGFKYYKKLMEERKGVVL
jgi:hypothetical protein